MIHKFFFGKLYIRFAIVLLLLGINFTGHAQEKNKNADSQFITNFLNGIMVEEDNNFEDAVKIYQENLKNNNLTEKQRKDIQEKLFNALVKTGKANEALAYSDAIIANQSVYAATAQMLKLADLIKKSRWSANDGAPLLQKEGAFGAILGGFIRTWGFVKIGNPNQGLENLREINKRGGFEQITLFHEANMQLLLNKPKEAIAVLSKNQAPEALPEPLQRTYIRALMANNQKQTALDYIKKISQNQSIAINNDKNKIFKGQNLEPLIPSAEAGLADALGRLASNLIGQLDEYALDISMIGLYLNPHNDELKIIAAQAYLGLKKYNLARKILESIAPNSDEYASAQITVSEMYFLQDKKQDALAGLENLLKTYPDSLEIQAKLANAYRGVEQFNDAEKIYSQIIKNLGNKFLPQHYFFFYSRGICYERTNRWSEAEKDLLKALELKPEDPYVQNYLGYSWVDRGENYEKALKLLENAHQQRQDDGYIADSVGWAYYKLQKPQEAIVYLEKAINLVPSDPVITDHLGDVSWVLGRKNQAMLYWTRSLELNPENKDKLRTEQKLKSGL